MEEVPGSEESLLALDEQFALTNQNEKGLLIRLGVVDAALTGLEHSQIDPELRELDRPSRIVRNDEDRIGHGSILAIGRQMRTHPAWQWLNG